MGVYNERILPYLMDWAMADEVFDTYRREALATVSGAVLEIGFGTGLNLPHYPSGVTTLATVDPSPGVHRLAQRRIQLSPIAVEHHLLSGEALPMGDRTFDCAVSTFTLCTIPKVEAALAEIYRVLKPGGRFVFVEHGLSDDPAVQRWQHRLTPLQKRIAGGCHFNRPIAALVQQQFDRVDIQADYAPKTPKLAGYFYRGIAMKS